MSRLPVTGNGPIEMVDDGRWKCVLCLTVVHNANEHLVSWNQRDYVRD